MKPLEHNQEINLQDTMSNLVQAVLHFEESKISGQELAGIAMNAAETFAVYQQILAKNGITLPPIIFKDSDKLN